MNILIADDSKLSRTTLTDALKELGHRVIEAESGEQALHLFKEQSPDLVILDVVMRGMDGFECATKMRKINKEGWIPIIFLSSSIDDEYIAQGIDAGGDDYLTKPCSKVTLAAKIKAMQRIADMRHQLLQITEQLNWLSRTDSLTGLYNRLEFEKKMKKSFAIAKRHQQHFALLFIDVDGFKGVNDKFGHHVGDQLIKEVAKRLTGCMRVNDFIARLGGDEFAIIIQPIDNEKQPEALAQKIIDASSLRFMEKIPITFSIGIACYPRAGRNEEELLVHADEAMYEVKKRGGNDYRKYMGQS